MSINLQTASASTVPLLRIVYSLFYSIFFFFSSRRRHTRFKCDWSSTCALPISSTSGVMLMAACIRAGSPSRIGRTFLLDRRRLDVSHFDVKPLELWYFEQAVHELGRSPIHFD